MSLFLVELRAPSAGERTPIEATARRAVEGIGGVLIETAHAPQLQRLYVVVDVAAVEPLRAAVAAERTLDVEGIAPVRLVGEAPSANVESPSHLVEWDLPAGLSLGDYLARKAQKTPLYAKVPEVRFLRTYVREDMVKCVCLYDAPDESAVRRAREAVSAPVDRLSSVTSAADDE
jgi:hypothetical protein